MNWNPLYPSNEDASSLEGAIREAEWEDDLRRAERERQEERGLLYGEQVDDTKMFL